MKTLADLCALLSRGDPRRERAVRWMADDLHRSGLISPLRSRVFLGEAAGLTLVAESEEMLAPSQVARRFLDFRLDRTERHGTGEASLDSCRFARELSDLLPNAFLGFTWLLEIARHREAEYAPQAGAFRVDWWPRCRVARARHRRGSGEEFELIYRDGDEAADATGAPARWTVIDANLINAVADMVSSPGPGPGSGEPLPILHEVQRLAA